ncbi:MAG: hypothetical protein FDX18_08450 [Chlorobium sp.]|nr:MAG: hypothetical protein FDX18_08450 [Chlorobium sp.]
MITEIRKKASFFIALAVTAFFLNFCWESIHGLLYEAHPAMAASDYVPMMLFMALMDALGITALYCFTALVARRWFWSGLRNSLFFFLSGLVAAYAVEYITLFELHLWQYRSSMPTLFGIGLFPLFQLSLTALFSLFVARRISA